MGQEGTGSRQWLHKDRRSRREPLTGRQFDYSGSQCLKALKEEGVETVLINPNIATIQTDDRLADRVYFLPITPDYVEKVIEREKPDGILLGFGGQTALNCGVQLAKRGVLNKHGVKVLGTPIKGIEDTEDRELFKRTMLENGVPVPRSSSVYSVEEAREVANSMGYPVIIRIAYSLGGKGGGVAHNEYELDEIVQRGLAASMVHQVLIEEYIGDWKQVEYEVMRDAMDNSITVCNMENVLSMRVHTGDNVVVAPSQTLNNREYHLLREVAIRATRACHVIGECNIQFALEPHSERYCAIEINARLSRSSALASKATGYPLAYMATKLAIGYTLPELTNKVTGITTACFEPALDYVVVKIPRWDFKKFERVDSRIGTQMKSVGEVMAIGRRFEEALQKAIRMLEIGKDGLVANDDAVLSLEEVEHQLVHPTDEVLFRVADVIRLGLSTEKIQELSVIDPWFVEKIRNIVNMEERLKGVTKEQLYKEHEAEPLIREAKKLGFSDRQMARLLGLQEGEVRKFRKGLDIVPFIKQIDTLAAEWEAKTNYLYLTYGGDKDDLDLMPSGDRVIVLGAGPYRIGSSVEFDWATMNMVWALKESSMREAIVINCNPETVSTDYDMSDRLYFEELTLERVLDIYEKERPLGIVTCVGGQTANNLTPKLSEYGAKILGTDSSDVDRAEDRAKFSSLLDGLGIPQPKWSTFTTLEDAKAFAQEVGYPVLIRPSYVLSGVAMRVVWTSDDLYAYLTRAAKVSPEYPVVVSKFVMDAKEVEVDAVSDGDRVIIGAIIEHVERAGIHSGDAIMSIPPQRLDESTKGQIEDYARRIARALRIKGPFNIQFIVKDKVYVIECNLRASRSMPFVSKHSGVNLMRLAAMAILNVRLPKMEDPWKRVAWIGVKAPQFSFMQLEGADTVLGVEMQSTGEVACFGKDFFDAFLKALVAGGYQVPKAGSGILITVGGAELKAKVLPIVEMLQGLGYRIYATEHTAEFLMEKGIRPIEIVYKISEPNRRPNIVDLLLKGKLDFVINIPSSTALEKYADMLQDEYLIRRRAVELGVPVLTNLETVDAFVRGLEWLRKNEPCIVVPTSSS